MEFVTTSKKLGEALEELVFERQDGFRFEPLVIIYAENPDAPYDVSFILTEFDQLKGTYIAHPTACSRECKPYPLLIAETGGYRYPILPLDSLLRAGRFFAGNSDENDIEISFDEDSIVFFSRNLEVITLKINSIRLDQENSDFSAFHEFKVTPKACEY